MKPKAGDRVIFISHTGMAYQNTVITQCHYDSWHQKDKCVVCLDDLGEPAFLHKGYAAVRCTDFRKPFTKGDRNEFKFIQQEKATFWRWKGNEKHIYEKQINVWLFVQPAITPEQLPQAIQVRIDDQWVEYVKQGSLYMNLCHPSIHISDIILSDDISVPGCIWSTRRSFCVRQQPALA